MGGSQQPEIDENKELDSCSLNRSSEPGYDALYRSALDRARSIAPSLVCQTVKSEEAFSSVDAATEGWISKNRVLSVLNTNFPF